VVRRGTAGPEFGSFGDVDLDGPAVESSEKRKWPTAKAGGVVETTTRPTCLRLFIVKIYTP